MAGPVLLVEDDDDQRDLLAWLLRRGGFEPVTTWSARHGLEILEHRPCDLAIFDVQLPGMSGLKALRIISRRRPWLPVLLVTASENVREAQALSLGARALLRKPFSGGEFLSAVREALAGASGPKWGHLAGRADQPCAEG